MQLLVLSRYLNSSLSTENGRHAWLTVIQGVSYSLSTLTIPTLLTLPSAAAAAKAFKSLNVTAKTQLQVLTGVSSAAFLLAFILSPRSCRHPYLLYTSLLVATSGFADKIAPYVTKPSSASSPQVSSAGAQARQQQARIDRQAAAASRAARARMEASYEVLGDAHSEGTGSASGEEVEEEAVLNGEEVKGEVDSFLKTSLVQTGLAAVGFLMAIVGIWGDGATQLYSETIVYM
jgi:autophagy-related protein 33